MAGIEEQDTFDRENLNQDVIRMSALWMNELNAPDILLYDDEMVAEMLDQIKNQQDYVDQVSEDRATLTEERSFINKLFQMEIDRLKYVVASYLRTRLRKIERFAHHILSLPALTQRLSPKEIQFVKQYVLIFENHVADVALSQFPNEHRGIDADGMIVEPDLDHFVFCESLASLGQLQCDDRGVEHISLRQGDRFVLRYRTIQNQMQDQQITLL